ncbi:riboflavin biosynthesis protein RibD [Methylopila sp. Yamaguchi]|nr:riboflavin biosynthesis protein RibD [Methylopila sp. Yamaguchi]
MMDALALPRLDGPDGCAESDARWMAVALALARRGLGRTAPNPSVGAVLVSPAGYVVGRGWTQPGGRPHAETMALAQAGEAAAGATLYVTLEPCSHHGRTPPCVDALVAAGVARVVAALRDPDPRVDGRGVDRLRAAGVAVAIGGCGRVALRIAAGHVRRVTLGRPHVTLKLAVSADDKVALAGRRPVAITGEASRGRVHMMRAEADAILIGIGTALADDPALTCRLPGMADRSPCRVVLDSNLRLPLTSRLVATCHEVPTWVVAAVDAPVEAELALRAAGCDVMRVERGPDGRLSLPRALKLLALRGVTRLMVEGGPTIAAGLLDADLVDEAVVARGPATLGSDAIGALEGRPLGALTEAARFAEIGRESVGEDCWTFFERA